MKNFVFIEKPALVSCFSGRMDEGFLSGESVKLIDRKSNTYAVRIIRKVYDQGNGGCLVDLI